MGNRLFRLLCFLLLVLSSLSAQACECNEPRERWTYALLQEQLEQPPHVFFGQVFAVTDTTFQVQVLEEFKGQVPQAHLTGTYLNPNSNSCGIQVRQGVWVFYTRLDTAGNISDLRACTFSANLADPALYLPPPDPRWKLDSLARKQLFHVQKTEQRVLFLQQWLTEYPLLVAYRRQHSPAPATLPASTWVPYMALAVALLALLIALFPRKASPLL